MADLDCVIASENGKVTMALYTNVGLFSALDLHLHHRRGLRLLCPFPHTRIQLTFTMEEASPVRTSHAGSKGVIDLFAETIGLGTYAPCVHHARYVCRVAHASFPPSRNSRKADMFSPLENSHP